MNNSFEVLTDTIRHISEVQENLQKIINELSIRGIAHDRTKFKPIEFDAFVSTRPKFKKANYGTPEYQECIELIKPSIEHHYKNNRHHTAFHNNGIKDMTLLDILEMLADWKAASRRSPNLTFKDSLPTAFKKYKIKEELQNLILNTLTELNWI
jgi:hypothetical protein